MLKRKLRDIGEALKTITAESRLNLRRAAILRESIEAAAMPETEAGTTIIQFGHCQLFTNRRELLVDGVPVPLGSRDKFADRLSASATASISSTVFLTLEINPRTRLYTSLYRIP